MNSDNEIEEALKYFRGKTIVVKYGGAAMQASGLKRCVVKDIVYIQSMGASVVLVHGGGPEISALQERLGLERRFVQGLRFTDEGTMDAVVMALCGKVNKELVRLIGNEGGRAVGLCGIDGGIIKCRKQEEPDLGYVGEIVKIKKELLLNLIMGDIIPVISSVGLGEDGLAYNINADTAAGRVAAALSADCFITLSDVPGVLHDMSDPTSLIVEMEVGEAKGLIESGVVSGGMIPKVRGQIDAISRGARTASIIDGRVPHALVFALVTRAAVEQGEIQRLKQGFVGTTIVA